MKKRSLFYLLSMLLVFGLVFWQSQIGIRAAIDNPSGNMAFTNDSKNREVTVKAGESPSVTINMLNGTKVCKIILITLVANESRSVKRMELPWVRETGSGTKNFNLDTSGLAPGKYRTFMYGNTSCVDGSVHGNQDDGFDCDGNPTCWSYCNGAGGTRPKVDTSQQAYEPGDLYRTNSNPAYPGGVKMGQNSCGEIGGSELSGGYRPNDCELKACDRTGQNLDSLTFNISDAAGNVPGPHGNEPVSGGAGQTPATPAQPGTPTSPTGDITLVQAKPGSVTAQNPKLTSSSTVSVAAGLSTVAADKKVVLNGETKTLTSYTGGDLTTKNISTDQKIGNVNVVIGTGSTLVGAMTVTNADYPDATMVIPSGTTIFGVKDWKGKIMPLMKTTTSGGEVPAGFKLGTMVVKAGSNEGPLIFDKPITLTIKSDAKDFAYKPAGGTAYVAIPKCEGSYATPTKPVYPGECYFSDGANVKIVTWHLTDFASLNLNTSVNFIGSSGGICLNRSDLTKVAVKVDWGANFGYGEYRIARSECSDGKTCTGPENFITTNFFPARVSPSMTYFDAVVDANKFYKYRVWGWRTGTDKPTGDNIASYDEKYWSLPVVVKASCDQQGTGINIQEFKVVPVQ